MKLPEIDIHELEKALADVALDSAYANYPGARYTDASITVADLDRMMKAIEPRIRVIYEPDSFRRDRYAALVGRVVERFSYKPHWNVARISRRDAQIAVEIIHPEIDVNDWLSPKPKVGAIAAITVFSEFELDALLEEENYIRHRVVMSIRAAELHEMDEWLRFDGKRVKEPHEPF
jgi:hypothetical protein